MERIREFPRERWERKGCLQQGRGGMGWYECLEWGGLGAVEITQPWAWRDDRRSTGPLKWVGGWVGGEAPKQHQWGALKSLFIFLEVSIESPGQVPPCHPFAVGQALCGGDLHHPQIRPLGEAGAQGTSWKPGTQAARNVGAVLTCKGIISTWVLPLLWHCRCPDPKSCHR